MSCHWSKSFVLLTVSFKMSFVLCEIDQYSECQIQDWKNGLPQPHKLFCGKPLEEQDEKEDASEDAGSGALDDAGIPQADPSYKRSPALLHQISLLTENPQMDYVVNVQRTR